MVRYTYKIIQIPYTWHIPKKSNMPTFSKGMLPLFRTGLSWPFHKFSRHSQSLQRFRDELRRGHELCEKGASLAETGRWSGMAWIMTGGVAGLFQGQKHLGSVMKRSLSECFFPECKELLEPWVPPEEEWDLWHRHKIRYKVKVAGSCGWFGIKIPASFRKGCC